MLNFSYLAILASFISPCQASDDFTSASIVEEAANAVGCRASLSEETSSQADGSNTDSPNVISRISPQYSDRCFRFATESKVGNYYSDIVKVKFDISPKGKVVNPEVTDSSNKCLNALTMRAIRSWRYEKSEDGKQGVTSTIYFQGVK